MAKAMAVSRQTVPPEEALVACVLQIPPLILGFPEDCGGRRRRALPSVALTTPSLGASRGDLQHPSRTRLSRS